MKKTVLLLSFAIALSGCQKTNINSNTKETVNINNYEKRKSIKTNLSFSEKWIVRDNWELKILNVKRISKDKIVINYEYENIGYNKKLELTPHLIFGTKIPSVHFKIRKSTYPLGVEKGQKNKVELESDFSDINSDYINIHLLKIDNNGIVNEVEFFGDIEK